MGRTHEWTFLQEHMQMAKRYMKRCSTSLIIREKHFKTIIRYHLTSVRMAKINNTGNNRCWQGCRERGTLLHCWWQCKLMQLLWKIRVEVPQKDKNRTTLQPSNSTNRYFPKDTTVLIWRGTYSHHYQP